MGFQDHPNVVEWRIHWSHRHLRCLETLVGWVPVLMALKAAVDFNVDLRSHDPQRTWDEGYVDN